MAVIRHSRRTYPEQVHLGSHHPARTVAACSHHRSITANKALPAWHNCWWLEATATKTLIAVCQAQMRCALDTTSCKGIAFMTRQLATVLRMAFELACNVQGLLLRCLSMTQQSPGAWPQLSPCVVYIVLCPAQSMKSS